jgi:putative membrane protein
MYGRLKEVGFVKTHTLIFVLALALSGFGLGACQRSERGVEAAGEKPDRTNALTTAERDFIRKASQSHLQEIDMGQLAQDKASNSEVKDYAKMIVNDHKKALKDLNSIMDKYYVDHANLEAKDQAHLNRLNKLTTVLFDSSFLDMMVTSHKKALENYQSAMNSAQNPDLKNHITDTTPTIEKHLNRAEQLQSQSTTTAPKTTRTR